MLFVDTMSPKAFAPSPLLTRKRSLGTLMPKVGAETSGATSENLCFFPKTCLLNTVDIARSGRESCFPLSVTRSFFMWL